ncbi:hypothetical protein [Kitasatospora camelliae]|uniref:Uncharacterized protein n=1 Tax=Kitasatospora camelliae TaxID=3156397 RepID=A0AAU8K6B7_9ACTN
MARIRSIKPDFFTSLTVADLPLSARLTFIGLWCYVDDNGVGIDEARLIRASVWPLDESPDILQRTREDLRRLQEALLVTRYTVSGRPFLAIRSWSEHQKISHPGKPRFPGPDQADSPTDTPPEQGKRNPPETFPSPPEPLRIAPEILAPEQGAGSRDIGKRANAPSEPEPAAKTPKRSTGAPDHIAVTDDMRAWAVRKGLEPPRIDAETERFLDHHRAKGSTFKDWTAAWRTWMSRAVDYTPRAATGTTGPRYTDPTERGVF